MTEKKINGATLAHLTGCSKASISCYLNGINVPSLKKMRMIADALGVTLADLNSKDGMIMPNITDKNTLTCAEAATLLHKTVSYVRAGLQQGRPGFEFGSAVKVNGKWSYCIYANKFAEITGIPLNVQMEDESCLI